MIRKLNLGPPLSVRRTILAVFLVVLYLASVSLLLYTSRQKDELQLEYSRLRDTIRESDPIKPIGLTNLGKVCYMSSVLQCLASIYDELDLETYQLRTEAMKSFRNTLRIIQQRDKITESAYKAEELYEELKKVKVIDAEAGEKDADEFFNRLTDKLPLQSAIWEQTFGYQSQSCISCTLNGHLACTSVSNLSFLLVVPVQPEPVRLESLLQQSCEAENIEHKCAVCDSTQSIKTLTVNRTNPVLVFVLKRYKSLMENTDPAYSDVQIPDDLFINGKHYTLRGAVLHAGNTSSAELECSEVLAHYLAIVRYGNDKFVCNDSEVTNFKGNIDEYNDSFRGKPFKPYMLFYAFA